MFHGHGEALAMLAGGAGILVAIVIGIVLLQGAMVPARRATTPSAESSPSATSSASSAIAYASPSTSTPTMTDANSPTPSVGAWGSLEEPALDSPTMEPDQTAAPTPKPTPKPTPHPTTHPTPTPSADARMALTVRDARTGQAKNLFWIDEGSSVEVILELAVSGLDRDQCSLTQVTKPDDPSIAASEIDLRPLAKQTVVIFDGWNTFNASCPSSTGLVRTSLRAVVHDGQPEACSDFAFTRDAITPTSFDELAAGVIGTWVGCATTPWTPMYRVTFVFREDGSYSAKSGEGLDGQRMVALYYGTDEDSDLKRYYLTDLQASRLGLGEIDVYFDVGTVVRDQLRNIRLMGDKVEFEMFHFGQYGPLSYRLERAS